MAEVLRSGTGNYATTSSGNSQFVMRIELLFLREADGGYYMQWNDWIKVLKGDLGNPKSFRVCGPSTAWTEQYTAVGSSTGGTGADHNNYHDIYTAEFFVAYGGTVNASSAYCYYNPSSGSQLRSTAYTDAYTVPRPTYTVSYNANGGSGAPSVQTKTYGINLTLSSTTPTRTGYTFLGWSTSSTATSATWGAGGTYTTNGGATLYAVWKINTWTVSYNANGGSGAPSAQTKTYGVTLTLSSTKPTRTGYNFLGWSTSNTATSATYTAGGSYTSNSGATLYAVWKIITYAVKYDANTGTGAPSQQTKTYGTNLTLSSTKPTKSNTTATGYTVTFDSNGGQDETSTSVSTLTYSYTFDSWNTNSAGTGTKYASGGTYTSNSAVTLYAKYNSSVSYGAVTLPTPKRSGYTFLGWATSREATSGQITPYAPTANTTLYAIWKADGAVRIRVGNEFKRYAGYIYSNNKWNRVIPYVWSNGQWKQSE